MKLPESFKDKFLTAAASVFHHTIVPPQPWKGEDRGWYDPSLSAEEMGVEYGKALRAKFWKGVAKVAPDGFDVEKIAPWETEESWPSGDEFEKFGDDFEKLGERWAKVSSLEFLYLELKK